MHDYERALSVFRASLEDSRRFAMVQSQTELLRGIGLALVGLDRRFEARETFVALLDLAAEIASGVTLELTAALAGVGLGAELGDARAAAGLRGAAAELRRRADLTDYPWNHALERVLEQPLIDALGPTAWESEYAAGATMTLDEAIGLARTLARAEVPTD